MATFDGSDSSSPIRFDLFDVADLISGSVLDNSTINQAVGTSSDFTLFSGSGFNNDGVLLDKGTINRIDTVAGSAHQYAFDGLAMPVTQFRGFTNTDNSEGFLAAALAGGDTVTGSQFGDYLQGFAGNDILIGDKNAGGGNDTLDGGVGADTMDGSDGNDLYIIDNAKDSVLGDLGGIDSVQSAVSYTLGSGIEHLFLTGTGALNGTGNDLANQIVGTSGANKLLGLDANDYLEGAAGNDTLDGGAGDDTMLGGAGSDVYFVDSNSDQAIEALSGSAGGTDIVFSSAAAFTLGPNIEKLTLMGPATAGTGNELANVITGDNAGDSLAGMAANDTLVGGTGNDQLDGGTGADSMSGGAGSDVYFVDDAGDKVTEAMAGAAGGQDAVEYSGTVGYVLGNNLEELEMTAAIGAVFGTGNSLANSIIGNASANVIDGKAGADTMVGGDGDDVYIVDNTKDVIREDLSVGNDTVNSSVNFNLTADSITVFGDIENLVLVGAALVGTGNTLDNQIIGDAGKNLLTGLEGNDTLDGGAGTDTLVGGIGNDLYVVDNAKDVISELGSDSGDTVRSSTISLDLTLPAYAGIENIELQGKLALHAAGNDGVNSITGNDGANLLSGHGGDDVLVGGAGNDTLDGGGGVDVMTGGAGDDTYLVDSFLLGSPAFSDSVHELDGGGIDTVVASSAAPLYVLPDFVENLTLAPGAGNLKGEGNNLANVLTGNEGSNVLNGEDGNDTINGGAGNDTVIGASGDDVINVSVGNDVVLFATQIDGHDVITGFDGNPIGGQDTVDLSFLFSGLGIASADRPSHVMLVDSGPSVDVRVDEDNNLLNGYETTVATIQTTDPVTIGQDVILG